MNLKPQSALGQILQRHRHEAQPGVVDTGRYRCAYYSWGTGPPIIFIHGLADVALSYASLCAGLAEQFRCIAYELPTGRDDGAPLRHYTHADLVADLFALLDHLQVEQSYLFGASFGSTIALAAAHAQPKRVPRLILQGGFAHQTLAPAEVWLARLGRSWRFPLRLMPGRVAVLRHVAYEPFTLCEPAVWRFFVENTGSNPVAALAYRALLVHQCDLRPLLPAIRQPVLLVCGDRDPVITTAREDELVRGLPHVGRVQLEYCGHFAYFTHPETLAQVVREFLTPPPCARMLTEECHRDKD
jgi:pimeloyl-ACP methyl ester carboxylesterase